jgi:hypothetical protein
LPPASQSLGLFLISTPGFPCGLNAASMRLSCRTGEPRNNLSDPGFP